MREVYQGICQWVAVRWFHRSSEDGTTSSGQMSFGFFDLQTHRLTAIAPGGAKLGFMGAFAIMREMLSPAAGHAGAIKAIHL